jgi:dTDP-4-amino-4,6-dideoxygalactose transaminase
MLRRLRMYGMRIRTTSSSTGQLRLDELQAAILSVKHRASRCDERSAPRDRAVLLPASRRGSASLAGHPTGVVSNHHVFVARVTGGRRDALVSFLEQRGIQANIYYVVPLHLQAANGTSVYRPR